MKTSMVKKENVKRVWHLIDAKDKILGRLTTQIASLIKGKHKPDITPHVDMGDGVVVINAEKIRVTGKKLEQKKYKRYSGYPGGLKEEPMKHLLARRPGDIIRHAVKGMLPKNKIGRKMFKRLKVYAGEGHPHQGQLASQKTKKEDK